MRKVLNRGLELFLRNGCRLSPLLSCRALYVALAGASCGLSVAATQQVFAQTADSSGLPRDPGAVLAAVASRYDYSALKPWHLKAAYQLFDDSGKPAEKGIFEYWWAAKESYRSSWTRGHVSYTEWHTADGKVAHEGNSEELSYFEYKLGSALVSPLTAAGKIDSTKFRLDDHDVTEPHSVVSCYVTVPSEPKADPATTKGYYDMFPTFCLNTKLHLLLGINDFGTQTVKFYAFKELQTEGKYLAHGLAFRQGDRDLLTAQVESVEEFSPADSPVTPPQSAKVAGGEIVPLDASAAQGLLRNKIEPDYPQKAKDGDIHGTVTFEAIIGSDGKIRDLQLLSAPAVRAEPPARWARNELVSSAFWAVSQEEYKPYLRNGEPVEVKTTVAVTFPDPTASASSRK